jgi:hypothetical protein
MPGNQSCFEAALLATLVNHTRVLCSEMCVPMTVLGAGVQLPFHHTQYQDGAFFHRRQQAPGARLRTTLNRANSRKLALPCAPPVAHTQ